ncbi:MAG: NAD-dependent epimerase/dehydratase family protein [archaeon]
MENKRILVIGGSGYIGQSIVSLLSKSGYDVTVLSRNSRSNNNKTINNKTIEGINHIRGNVLDKNFLMKNIKNFDVILYLAAVIRTLRKSRYSENVIGLKNTLQIMNQNKINKILYFSTQNVHLKEKGYYSSSKKECEEILISSNLDYVIIRPNYVYSVDKNNDFYKLYRIIKMIRLCPIISDGKTKFKPVNREDIAKITLGCLNNWKSRMIFDVSGKTTMSIKEFTDFVRDKKHIRFLKIYTPIFLLRLFKRFVPFDVDGYMEDRIFLDTKNNILGESDFKEDLIKIINLT